ncbi:murein peptide amidase A [Acidovorax sp. HDW3]|uniref:M14 family zinc carboxypeptidase n=1 Tax=Acidovorax sp. HDW3 TaxID=2714923 RepID=UPI00140B95EC|nr:M14 family zinc carboxypeptidase [Acidovorax sp. HDW3]QIL45298.1 murein peptide amidase A [Acidovorax sp. HDW3]
MTEPFSLLWRRAGAALTCSLPLWAAANTPATPPRPSSRPLAEPCTRAWLARLPGINQAQCQALQLVPSGARSRLGRPLLLRDLPAPAGSTTPLRVLVVGAIHGDELTAAALALQWLALAEKSPRSVHWRFIPLLNPDGLLAKRPTRVNARGVDLNRNFATPGWERDAPLYWEKRTRKDPRRWPGPAPLSEPETQFLQAQLQEFSPQLVVSIHAPYGVLDFDGPHTPPQRLGRLHLERVGLFPGSLGHYGSVQQGLPVVTIELEHAQKMPRPTDVQAMWHDLLRWMDQRLQPALAHSDEKPQKR